MQTDRQTGLVCLERKNNMMPVQAAKMIGRLQIALEYNLILTNKLGTLKGEQRQRSRPEMGSIEPKMGEL